MEGIHRVTHKFLMDFLEVAQFFQESYPDQMQIVWQMFRADLVQSGIPLILALPQETPLPKIEAPRTRAGPLLRVGDICRYRGPTGSMNVTCQGRDLKVLQIKGEVATVDALPNTFYKHGWNHPYDIETRYLRKA